MIDELNFSLAVFTKRQSPPAIVVSLHTSHYMRVTNTLATLNFPLNTINYALRMLYCIISFNVNSKT